MRIGTCAGSEADTAERIGRLAVRALLREVAAGPKPGLVDRFGSGSHDDMDFMTFSDSALALGPSFAACAREGLERGRSDPGWPAAATAAERGSAATGPAGSQTTLVQAADAAVKAADAAFLAALRLIGIQGEKEMFAATGGINTHKGALFLVGFQAAAAGALLGAGIPPTADRIRRLAARVARGIADRELPAAYANGTFADGTHAKGTLADGTDTHGAAAFRAHGSRGIRGEVESGLSSLDSGALALLRSASSHGNIDDTACVDTLLLLMTIVDDTTVLHRGGADALAFVRRSAFAALALGGSATAEGRAELGRMGREFEARRISPGGSADLLSAGIFLAETEREFAGSARGHSAISSGARRPIKHHCRHPGAVRA
ncbi:MAG: hypothetical protein A2001_21200 [Treponema sp. GWC1_61_84]|nr:MAG: hypothetical protein A2001_21200 [Treponema sp. GWC1_61_84]